MCSANLGVTIQSDLKLQAHISSKITNANRTLAMIKQTLHAAPEKAKLHAYTSLCRPLLEYRKEGMSKHRDGSKPSNKVY